jgi:predicted phosphodiesterase
MRIAAIYDIHGNLPALEAVIDEIEASGGVDLVLVGGDVLPGPLCGEALVALSKLSMPVRFIHGNGETDVLAMRAGREPTGVPESALSALRWVADALSDEDAAAIGAWPGVERIDLEGLGRVLFCHATPRDDRELFTRITPEARLLPIFEAAEADVVICGHTHIPFDRMVGDVRVVNAGSVGMPFGTAGAHWALVTGEPAPIGIQLRVTDYDRDAAAARMRESGYPDVDGFVKGALFDLPGADEMTELFERSVLTP